MQHLFHSLGPEYQQYTDWSRQLPFEPGFVARYTRRNAVAAFGNGDHVRASLAWNWGGAVGTIRTEAMGGGSAVADLLAFRAPGSESPLHLILEADARERLVLRDEFLDGTLFSSSESVLKEPFVAEGRASLTLRWRQIDLTYRASRTSRLYKTQPQTRSWGTIEAEWRFSR
jgi:hypothetical protein